MNGTGRPKGILQVTTPSEREIAMTRVFNAPRELVFKALTTPELVKKWLTGPPGWSMEVCEIDLRVGGAYRYVWNGPTKEVMGLGGVFREIVRPEQFSATEKFDNPWYPGEAIVSQALVEANGVTTLTLTVLYESQVIRDGVLKTPMEQGVGASFNNLAEMLETR